MAPRDAGALCQVGVKKEHKAELENGGSDAKTLGVFGSWAFE